MMLSRLVLERLIAYITSSFSSVLYLMYRIANIMVRARHTFSDMNRYFAVLQKPHHLQSYMLMYKKISKDFWNSPAEQQQNTRIYMTNIFPLFSWQWQVRCSETEDFQWFNTMITFYFSVLQKDESDSVPYLFSVRDHCVCTLQRLFKKWQSGIYNTLYPYWLGQLWNRYLLWSRNIRSFFFFENSQRRSRTRCNCSKSS